MTLINSVLAHVSNTFTDILLAIENKCAFVHLFNPTHNSFIEALKVFFSNFQILRIDFEHTFEHPLNYSLPGLRCLFSWNMRTNAIVNGGGPLRRGMMVMGRIASILPTRRSKSAITAERLEVGWIWFHKGAFLRTCDENRPGDCR